VSGLDALTQKVISRLKGAKRKTLSRQVENGKTHLNGPTKGVQSGSRVDSGSRRSASPELGGSRYTRASETELSSKMLYV